jgi:hypothetical protein
MTSPPPILAPAVFAVTILYPSPASTPTATDTAVTSMVRRGGPPMRFSDVKARSITPAATTLIDKSSPRPKGPRSGGSKMTSVPPASRNSGVTATVAAMPPMRPARDVVIVPAMGCRPSTSSSCRRRVAAARVSRGAAGRAYRTTATGSASTGPPRVRCGRGRTIWGALDLSARSGEDRVYDVGADRQIWRSSATCAV